MAAVITGNAIDGLSEKWTDFVSRLAIVKHKVAILAWRGDCCPVSAFIRLPPPHLRCIMNVQPFFT